MNGYRLTAIVIPTLLSIASAHADTCGSRPGTPFPSRVVVGRGGSVSFIWTNTQREGGLYYDVQITDGAGHLVRNYSGKDFTGNHQAIPYGTVVVDNENLPYGTKYCFVVRGRSGSGTNGCVSDKWSLSTCATTPTAAIDAVCTKYAETAVVQVGQIQKMQPIGECNWKSNPRWSTKPDDHYGFCIAERAQGQTTDVTENNERARILKTCVPLGKTASTAKPPTPAPTAQKPAQQTCTNVNVQITNKTCTNGDGSPMASNPPGALTTVGCGATEDAATQAAENAFFQAQGPCLDDGKGAPIAGCCTYTKTVVSKTVCSCGAQTRSLKRYNQCGGAKPIGTAPFCCPANTVYSNGACHNLRAAQNAVPGRPVPPAPPRRQ